MIQSSLPVDAPSRPTLRTIRADLADGTLTLPALLRDPPPVIADWSILEVLALPASWGRARRAVLNDEAVMVGVNLALPIGMAPGDVLDWAISALERQATYRRGALDEVRDLAHQRSVMGPEAWAARARMLDRAIREHRAMCEDESAPPEAFGQADAMLYGARDRAMHGSKVYAAPVKRAAPTVDVRPFAAWLEERRRDLARPDDADGLLPIPEVIRRTEIGEGIVRDVVAGERPTVRADTVERALAALGDQHGRGLADLYPEL